MERFVSINLYRMLSLFALALWCSESLAERTCVNYAKSAVAQNEINIASGCGIIGHQWSSEYYYHYNWCLGGGNIQSVAELETQRLDRRRDLRSCLPNRVEGGWRKKCHTYARTAVNQNERNQLLSCGFHDWSWSSDNDDHYRWCADMQPRNGKTLRQQQLKRRNSLLICGGQIASVGEPSIPRYRSTNPCVRNVESVFLNGVFAHRKRTSGGVEMGPTGLLHIWLREGESLPPDYSVVTGAGGLPSHVQSIARVGLAGKSSSWLIMARQRRSPGAPFYVFKLGNIPQSNSGERFVSYNPFVRKYYDTYRENISGFDQTVAYVEVPGTDHLGGMQVLGDLVAMPATCDVPQCSSASIMFWDFRDPTAPVLVHELKLPPPHEAHWVAATYLDSGKLFVIVNRSDNGTTDAFISKTSNRLDFSSTWDRLARFNIRTTNWDTRGTYQNVNFLQSCETGKMYLLGMRQRGTRPWTEWQSDNEVELFSVEGNPNILNPLSLRYVSSAKFGQFSDFCEMRGGSNLYIEPHGSPVVYCSAGQSKRGRLKVSEITSIIAP